MICAPTTLTQAQDIIRSMHAALLRFRHPDFAMVKPGCEAAFDLAVKDVLALSAPQILADRAAAPAVSDAPPHQQRVLAEKMDRDQEITRLDTFIRESSVFQTLPVAEQARLRRQLDVMHELSAVLGERIANF